MMANILLLFYLLFSASICSNNRFTFLDQRIVNGIPTTATQFPFIASLSVAHPVLYPRCGGSILRKEYPAVILTAAHCVTDDNGNLYRLMVDLYSNDVHPEQPGDSGNYTEWKPLYTIYHELFNATTFDNDIGLVFLDANLTNYHQYEEIIIANDTTYNSSCCNENELLTIIGYGYKKYNGKVTDTLEYSNVLFMNRTECNIKFTQWYIDTYNVNVTNITFPNDEKYWEFATENQICAIGDNTDACQGDSGGPLMKMNTNQQVGIISTGFGCNQNIPGIYTNLGLYYQWIDEQINDYNITFDTTETEQYVTDVSTSVYHSSMMQINETINVNDNINGDNHDNLQLVIYIGCSIAGFVVYIVAIIYLMKSMKCKKSEKYNRMKEELSIRSNGKKKEKLTIKHKTKTNKNDMEGALNVNVTSKVEMNTV
eukprot:469502_1